LKGYFQGEGYFYEDPLDIGVYKNEEVIKHLPKNNIYSVKRPFWIRTRMKVAKLLPNNIKVVIKKMIGK